MNEQMQGALVKIIEKAISGIDVATGFLSSEIPDVIHQLLVFNMVSSLLYLFFGVAILSACAYCLFRFSFDYYSSCRSGDSCWCHDGSTYAPITGLGALAVSISILIGVFLIFLTISCAVDVAKIYFAPKIWLIEYVSEMARSRQ